MDRLVALRAVQVSSVHHQMPNGGDAWQILVLALAMTLTGYGTVLMLRTNQWRIHAVPARGRVIDTVTRTTRRKEVTWLAVIEFEAEGHPVIIESRAAGGRTKVPLGDPVEILYDRADPHRAGLAASGWSIPWSVILGLAVMGVFVAIVVGV